MRTANTPMEPVAPAAPSPGPTPRRLHPRAITLWRIQRVVRLLVVGLPFAIGVGVGVAMMTRPAIGGVIGGAMVTFNLLTLAVWPSLEYEAYSYTVREHDLLVQSGVLFRRWSTIPLSRIQHVDTRQGPIERSLGLARLLVYTAAGMSADGSIPGLGQADAERLRDELSRRGGDDGV